MNSLKIMKARSPKEEEIYVGYINGKLCRFVLCFDQRAGGYIKVAV